MSGLSVVVPSRNVENLVPCLEAVRKFEPDLRILIADDGLDLGWLPRPDLMPAFGFRCERPFVYARNCNLCIGKAESDDVILLNDDAQLMTPGGFTAMQRAAEEHPEYGVISAVCNSVGNPNQFPRVADVCNGGLRFEPRMVCFVAVLIPRRTIDLVGLLDERFEGYGYDDDDYCLRVRQAGLKIGIFDGCFVDHASLKSTFRGGAYPVAAFERNRQLFEQKWGAGNHAL